MRTCPRCEIPLEVARETFAEIDTCPSCAGAFFDPGEAGAVHSASAEPSLLLHERRAVLVRDSRLRCPAEHPGDGDGPAPTLRLYRVGDVEVDLCPACGGVWLDEGEGEAVAEAARAMAREARAAEERRAQTHAQVLAEAREEKGGSFLTLIVEAMRTARLRRRGAIV